MRRFDHARMATMRTTDGLRLVVGQAYWAAVAINRQATRAGTTKSGSIRDRARSTKELPLTVDRPTFILHLRPEAHCPDHIRALRAVLKRSLRDYALRCVTIQTTNSKGFVVDQFRPGSAYLSRLADARETELPDLFPDSSCEVERPRWPDRRSYS